MNCLLDAYAVLEQAPDRRKRKNLSTPTTQKNNSKIRLILMIMVTRMMMIWSFILNEYFALRSNEMSSLSALQKEGSYFRTLKTGMSLGPYDCT